MRFITAVASTAFAMALATPGLAQTTGEQASVAPAAAPAVAGEPTDAELVKFAAAYAKVREVAAQVQNNSPTAEQQGEMAAAIQNSGLEVERFNAISTALATDEVLQARVKLAGETPSAAGSVGAGVTEAEATQYGQAMKTMADLVASLNGAQPNEAQQAQMVEAITNSGLAVDRFNEISTASSADAHLKARLDLAQVRASQ